MSIVEQRLDAVRAVLDEVPLSEVAAEVGVHRATLHRWVTRYLSEGLPGLADRSHRPLSCPHQVEAMVEVRVAEIRREHPRWGAKRIRMEVLRRPGPWASEGLLVPAERTIVRILQRQGLAGRRPRRRPRDSFTRFERPAPMQLWGIDIVGGVPMVDPGTGELWEAKVVTGIDDHSRFCVMARVVARATGRAVCVAFAQALAAYGVPEEVLTDNGKQFTDRFGRYRPRHGEVLFDKICRKNGIAHRLTEPESPNQNGKVERFHGTFRPEFLAVAEPFASLQDAQTAVDVWVVDYNAERPHQGLDDKLPVTPGERFSPVPAQQRELVELWLPPSLSTVPEPAPAPEPARVPESAGTVVGARPQILPEQLAGRQTWAGGAVEFDRAVPASGNLGFAGKQFWLGTLRAGLTATIWADCDLIHVLIGGTRIKTIRSHLSVNDLARLVAEGARNSTVSPLPPVDADSAERGVVEVERCVARPGTVSLGQHVLLAAEILAGRRVGIRIEPALLLFFDLETRELLRTRKNPLTADQVKRLRGTRPPGPPPRPSTEPVRVQRRASNTGVIMVAGQQVALGRIHRHQTVTVLVSETTLAVELDDGDTRTVRRTTDQPVRSIKGQRPRTASVS
ncbi:MAG: IS481 family transposase [Nocardioidaceae bacterium]